MLRAESTERARCSWARNGIQARVRARKFNDVLLRLCSVGAAARAARSSSSAARASSSSAAL